MPSILVWLQLFVWACLVSCNNPLLSSIGKLTNLSLYLPALLLLHFVLEIKINNILTSVLSNKPLLFSKFTYIEHNIHIIIYNYILCFAFNIPYLGYILLLRDKVKYWLLDTTCSEKDEGESIIFNGINLHIWMVVWIYNNQRSNCKPSYLCSEICNLKLKILITICLLIGSIMHF